MPCSFNGDKLRLIDRHDASDLDALPRHCHLDIERTQQQVEVVALGLVDPRLERHQHRGHLLRHAIDVDSFVLREAGLVTVREEGIRRFYAVDQAGLDAAHAWLARLADPLGQFEQPLDALTTEVARGRRARRATPAEQPAQRPGGDAATRTA